MKQIVLLLCALALAGCGTVKPLKPGTARIQSNVGTNGVQEFVSEMKQPENPAQSAAQNFERITETELPIPAQSKVHEVIIVPPSEPGREAVKQEKTIVLAA